MSESEQCSICKEIFNKPRVLPCLHRFCTKCLQEWIDNSATDTFTCPLCRCCTKPPPDSGMPKNKWAYTFPIDDLIVDKCNEFTNPKTIRSNLCDVCMKQNYVRVDTIAFCRYCKLDLCPSCFQKHQPDHEIILSQNLINSPLFLSRKAQLIPDIFCFKCKVYTYADLVQSKHTTCEGEAKSLKDVVKKLKEKNNSKIESLNVEIKHHETSVKMLSEIDAENKPFEKVTDNGESDRKFWKKLDDEICKFQHAACNLNTQLQPRMAMKHRENENDFLYFREYTKTFTLNEEN